MNKSILELRCNNMIKNRVTMKKIGILMVVFFEIGCVYGQTESKSYFGVRYSFGSCYYRGYESSGYSSSQQYEGKSFHEAGFDYKRRNADNVDLLLGLTWTFNKMIQTNSRSWSTGSGGGVDTYSGSHTFNVLSLDVFINFHSNKYFFIGGGPCLNYHPQMGYTWGIGLGIHAGLEYVFRSGLAVSISSRGKVNFLDLFGKKDSMNMNMDMDILSQLGGSIGLGYRFGK